MEKNVYFIACISTRISWQVLGLPITRELWWSAIGCYMAHVEKTSVSKTLIPHEIMGMGPPDRGRKVFGQWQRLQIDVVEVAYIFVCHAGRNGHGSTRGKNPPVNDHDCVSKENTRLEGKIDIVPDGESTLLIMQVTRRLAAYPWHANEDSMLGLQLSQLLGIWIMLAHTICTKYATSFSMASLSFFLNGWKWCHSRWQSCHFFGAVIVGRFPRNANGSLHKLLSSAMTTPISAH